MGGDAGVISTTGAVGMDATAAAGMGKDSRSWRPSKLGALGGRGTDGHDGPGGLGFWPAEKQRGRRKAGEGGNRGDDRWLPWAHCQRPRERGIRRSEGTIDVGRLQL